MSRQDKFKPGDIVKLKSGGPDMTIQEEQQISSGGKTGKYWCQWFAGKKLERGNFPADSIELSKKLED